MALEFALYLETNNAPKRVLELLFEGIGIEAQIDLSNRHGGVSSRSGPAFMTYAYNTSIERASFLEDELGIQPKITILFRLDKQEPETQKKVMLRAMIELITQLPGDAVLLFNGEVVWLLRKRGQLVLNSSIGLWTPEYLLLVSLPYTMEEIPIL